MTSEELRAAFSERVPLLDAYGNWVTQQVVAQVKRQLGASYSDYFFKVPPRHRVKDVDGFVEKSMRQGKSYSDPLKDITDQVGARFVILLFDQCEIVNTAIQAVTEWEAENAKDIEEVRKKDPHHFDYESYHWTVHQRHDLQIDGVLVPKETTCEIQVRTLLQHAYAELAHSTVYKPKTSAKPKVKRIIARGAALIETTDAVFMEVAREIEAVLGKAEHLLEKCAEWYAVHVENGHYPPSGVALRVTDAFAERLAKVQWSVIEEFLAKKPWLPDAIRSNPHHGLFKDPVILLVFWLVSQLEGDINEEWPLDLSYLEPVFTKLGISHGDSLH